jgi:gluconolactonase
MGMKKSFWIFILFTLLVLTGSQLTNNTAHPEQVISTHTTDPSSLAASPEAVVIESPNFLPTQEITELNTKQTFDLTHELLLETVSGTYQFAEGPVNSPDGSVYFSDIKAGRIYKWNLDGSVNIFVEGLNAPNGLAFDSQGTLVVCESGNGRLIAIDSQGVVSVVADQYNGVRFNEPNDLWIDPQGGIYFTDPSYNLPVVQEGEGVYYISPDHSQVIRVINNLVKPNGIDGSKDGKKLYVSDWGKGQTFVYHINQYASLSNPQLIVASGSDGLTLDPSGNLYLTTPNQVSIYDAAGKLLQKIPTPENPTNVAFAGTDGQILFITARTAVYTVQISEKNSKVVENPTSPVSSGFNLTSPEVADGGRLPAEYTCDGNASTLALSWSGTAEGTKSYAIIMDHIASPTDIHLYLLIYNIPANVTSLPKNFNDIGNLGTNSVNGRNEYAPPCSKGPGDKTYTYTVYALSSEPELFLTVSQVTREVLLESIKDSILARAELKVVYARP